MIDLARDRVRLAARLTSWANAHRDELVRDLAALVALDAPSADPAGLAPICDLIERRLTLSGAEVRHRTTPGGTHLEARHGNGDVPPVVILVHYDVVWPAGTAALRPLRIDGDVAFGPGVYDMRGGIVAALGALRALCDLEALDRPVVVLATADEETGSVTSEAVIRELGSTAHVVLIPEPPLASGGIKTARKGVLTYRVDVEGRAAHAGLAPASGVSAIRSLVDASVAMDALARPDAGTTVNVGVIGGGVSANVIAPSAFADIDVRVETVDEFKRMESALAAIGGERDGARITVSRVAGRPPMERTPAIAAVAEEVKRLGALVGLELDEGSAGGASDGNFVAPLGVPVVDGLGPVGGGAHALDEHISLTSMVERVALMSLLIALL